jgi:hypothetical protein
MLWFYLLITVLLFATVSDYYKRYAKITLFLSFSLLLLVAGFRNMGGSDYIVYWEHFNGFEESRWEIGYEFLVAIFRFFGFHYYFFVFFVSFLSLIILFYCIRKYSLYPQFSLMLYFGGYFVYYNLIATRQLMALMIFLFSLQYLIDKKDLKFLMFIFFGSLFHSSILILIPAYLFIRFFKFNVGYIIVACFLITIILQLKIEDYVSFFSTNGVDFVESRMVDGYMLDDRSLPITTFVRIGITFFLFGLSFKKFKNIESFIIYFKFYILFVLLFSAFNQFDVMMRIWIYFEIPSIFLIPMVLKQMNEKYLKFFFYFLYLSFFISSLLVLLNGFDDGDLKKFNLIFF